MLREARHRSGLSQEEVAFRVGIHTTNLSKIENARFAPNALLLLALMAELEIPPKALGSVLGKSVNARRAALEVELASFAENLSDEGLAIAVEQLRPLTERFGKPKGGRSPRASHGQR